MFLFLPFLFFFYLCFLFVTDLVSLFCFKTGKKINFNFLFKKSTYLHGKKTFADPVERDLMYYQLSAEVLDGVLPISIEMVPKVRD